MLPILNNFKIFALTHLTVNALAHYATSATKICTLIQVDVQSVIVSLTILNKI